MMIGRSWEVPDGSGLELELETELDGKILSGLWEAQT